MFRFFFFQCFRALLVFDCVEGFFLLVLRRLVGGGSQEGSVCSPVLVRWKRAVIGVCGWRCVSMNEATG